MTGITHAAAGAAIGAAAGVFSGHEFIGVLVSTLAALLPDVDHPGSVLGRVLRPLAVWLEEKYGHRNGPTHTLQFSVLMGLVLGVIPAVAIGSLVPLICGVLGAVSHLFLDSMTRSGIQPLRVYLPGPPLFFDRAHKGVRELARLWRRIKTKIENSSWSQKRWSGPIYTGQDPREFALAVFCIVLTGLFIVKIE